MKAIFTKYHGPTNYKGSRITASDSDGNKVTIPYNYEVSDEDVYKLAADALMHKMGWTGELVGGWYTHGMVFVFSNEGKLKRLLRAMVDRASMTYPHFEKGNGKLILDTAKKEV
jgi:hypothetical protein